MPWRRSSRVALRGLPSLRASSLLHPLHSSLRGPRVRLHQLPLRSSALLPPGQAEVEGAVVDVVAGGGGVGAVVVAGVRARPNSHLLQAPSPRPLLRVRPGPPSPTHGQGASPCGPSRPLGEGGLVLSSSRRPWLPGHLHSLRRSRRPRPPGLLLLRWHHTLPCWPGLHLLRPGLWGGIRPRSPSPSRLWA